MSVFEIRIHIPRTFDGVQELVPGTLASGSKRADEVDGLDSIAQFPRQTTGVQWQEHYVACEHHALHGHVNDHGKLS